MDDALAIVTSRYFAPMRQVGVVTRRRILVVDDEPSLRQTLARALQGMGYEVVTAGDPHRWPTSCSTPAASISCCSTSTCPQMSGDALYLALVRRWPRHRRPDPPDDRRSVGARADWPAELRRCPVLAKPFRLDLLARTVVGDLAAADAAAPSGSGTADDRRAPAAAPADPLATLREYRGLAPWGLRDLAALAAGILDASASCRSTPRPARGRASAPSAST